MGLKALIVGATGLVGRELVNLLLNSGEYDHVTILVRKEMNMTAPNLEQQVIDFNELENIPADLVKNATIFCTLGTTMKKAKTKENFKRVDYDYPMMMGRLADRYDADQMLIVTAMGASANSLFFYNKVKGQVEEDLQKLKLHKLHIFRPSLIVGERLELRRGEQIAANIANKTPFLFKGIMKKYKPVEAQTIARAMLNVSLDKDKTAGIISSGEIGRLGDTSDII